MMDRHTLEKLRNQVYGLLGRTKGCNEQAEELMVENFSAVADFAMDNTKPKPKPKHTIADNYPAGGLTKAEPCMFCEDHEQLQADNEKYSDICEGLHEDCAEFQAELAAGKRLWMDAQKRCKAQALRGDKLQAELEKHRWIPVTERLPKHSDTILACGKDGYGYKITAVVSYDGEFNKFF